MDLKPALQIREFSYPEDYPAARTLWENAGPGIQLRRSDTPEEIEKKLARDPDLFLVAELEGQLVGTVLGGFDGRRGLIYHLAVEASVREHGIGAVLMEEVERRLKAKGCIRNYLLVTTENEQAMRFYEKRGWSRMDSVFIYGKDL
ncbi:MAG: GNAT family N-acetyltransferase [Chloroflexi bacterium]|nr:GNAT family N-acetyltransferase [Chloroflexota bacterium]